MAADSPTSKLPPKAPGRWRPTHGMRNTPEYSSWASIIQRCYNPNRGVFSHYGGRGIKVCERWLSFANFFADMGPKPSPDHSIDRYPDQNGDYEPTNCRWATQKQQMRNVGYNHLVEFRGREMTIAEACEIAGLKEGAVRVRLYRGWSIERALSEPIASRSTATRRR